MSATNSTPIINLPLFIGTDKPAWLTDWNGAMNIIDTAIANLQTAESGTATSLASLAQSVESLSGTVSQHTTAIQTVTNATAGNTGSINTINALIGNGQPTTTDKTIIGAINEIYADIGGGDGVDADEVNYSNTASGLTATNVQAAIDELAHGGTAAADDVSFDNTGTGLSATNVQDALEELSSENLGLGTVVDITTGHGTASNTPYVTPSDGYIDVESTSSSSDFLTAKILGANASDTYDASAPQVQIRSFGDGTTSTFENIYVKRGMKVFVDASGNTTAKFIPFV